MRSLRVPNRACALAFAAVALAFAAPAAAQVRPGGPAGGPGSPTQGPQATKPAGVAEQAPKDESAELPTTNVLPPPKSDAKKFTVFELDGYFRFRGDWMREFDLGFDDVNVNPVGGGAPFPTPQACASSDEVTRANGCGTTLQSANIRLRLEPRINISERASVHAQIDVLDNVVLGSTPEGFFLDGTRAPANVPLGAFGGTQVSPQAGRNSLTDSIRVKRAWAEVVTPLGLLKFGRMPTHWGRGILENAGGLNTFDGTYDYDSDYGDNVDRVMFGTMVPGTQLRATVATDWPSVVPVSSQTGRFVNRFDGQAFDLDDEDDLRQWRFTVAKLDSPQEFQEKIDRGELGLNYGALLLWRSQDYESVPQQRGEFDLEGQPSDINDDLDPDFYFFRNFTTFTPDVYVRLGYGNWRFEAEGVAVLGDVNVSASELRDRGDFDESFRPGEYSIQSWGGVAEATYGFLDGDLRLGVEMAFATGDDFEPENQGQTHVSVRPTVPNPRGDQTFSEFRFNFDYEVDLILFRELLGTVYNAAYVKPKMDWNVTRTIRWQTQALSSWALNRVSTPGNANAMGLEFNTDVGYNGDHVFAGLAYGILFPFAALDHPTGDAFPFQNPSPNGATTRDPDNPINVGSAGIAQTLQVRLGLKF